MNLNLIIKILFYLYLFLIIKYLGTFFKNHFLLKEKNLPDRYGYNSWVIVTGCSNGQGKDFALEFANRGFNIILVGSIRIVYVSELIKKKFNVKTITIIKDFSDSFENKDFFKDIEKEIKDKDVSILVNNVGYRTAWEPFHEMPTDFIRKTIVVGCYVQTMLIKLFVPKFIKRNKKSAIINITAQCMHPNLYLGISNEISVPFLSVYEASNAFGFYQANSIQKEYSQKKYNNFLDFLTICPGAVRTEKTSEFFKNQAFCVNSDIFVKNIIKLLGNVNGIQYGYYGHEISGILINFIPFLKNKILFDTGKNISSTFMLKNNI